MNLLFLMGTYPSVGGVEKVSTILSNEFIQRGYGVSIASFVQPDPEIAEKELSKKVNLYSLSYPVYSKSNILRLREIILKENIDIIICQWAVPFFVARLCRKAIKNNHVKLITVHHNQPDTNSQIKRIEIDIEYKRGLYIYNTFKLFLVKTISSLSLRYVYRKSDLYVLLSPRFKKVFQKFSHLRDLSKIYSLPNPVTIVDKQSAWVKKENIILYVGRLDYNQKRCNRLLEIWENLFPKFSDWKLVVVGDGPSKEEMLNTISEKKLQNVELVGFQNPAEFYNRSKILLLTSEYEGFPLVILEAMTYSVVPVVLGSYEAVYDIIDNGGNGFITNYPFSANDTARVVENLIENNNLLSEIAANAKITSKQYELREIANQWERLFRSLSNQ